MRLPGPESGITNANDIYRLVDLVQGTIEVEVHERSCPLSVAIGGKRNA